MEVLFNLISLATISLNYKGHNATVKQKLRCKRLTVKVNCNTFIAKLKKSQEPMQLKIFVGSL